MSYIAEIIQDKVTSYIIKFKKQPRAIYLGESEFELVLKYAREYDTGSFEFTHLDRGRFQFYGIPIYRVDAYTHFEILGITKNEY